MSVDASREQIEKLLQELLKAVFGSERKRVRGHLLLPDGPAEYKIKASVGLDESEKHVYDSLAFKEGCGCPGVSLETKKHSFVTISKDEDIKEWATKQGITEEYAQCLREASVVCTAAYPFFSKSDRVLFILMLETSLEPSKAKLDKKDRIDRISNLTYTMAEFIPSLNDEVKKLDERKKRYW